MKHIIKKILKEEINTKVINLILNSLNSNRIKPPYFKNLKDLGLNNDEIKIILSEYTGGKINLKKGLIHNEKGNLIYGEDSDGDWVKWGYDERGNRIYHEDSDGDWYKKEYDDDGFLIYHENSDEGVKIDKR
jgi:YD repeat-containing protein